MYSYESFVYTVRPIETDKYALSLCKWALFTFSLATQFEVARTLTRTAVMTQGHHKTVDIATKAKASSHREMLW
jgi:hypothetical protein